MSAQALKQFATVIERVSADAESAFAEVRSRAVREIDAASGHAPLLQPGHRHLQDRVCRLFAGRARSGADRSTPDGAVAHTAVVPGGGCDPAAGGSDSHTGAVAGAGCDSAAGGEESDAGPASGAAAAFKKLSQGLDTAIVRVLVVRSGNVDGVRATMRAALG